MRLFHVNTQGLQEVLPSKASFTISSNKEAGLDVMRFPLRIAITRIDMIPLFANLNHTGASLELTVAMGSHSLSQIFLKDWLFMTDETYMASATLGL